MYVVALEKLLMQWCLSVYMYAWVGELSGKLSGELSGELSGQLSWINIVLIDFRVASNARFKFDAVGANLLSRGRQLTWENTLTMFPNEFLLYQ